MLLNVSFRSQICPIYIQSGILDNLDGLIDTKKKTLIVSDDKVPQQWIDLVFNQLADAEVFCFPHGESSKNIGTWSDILEKMAAMNITRQDQLIAVGGGVAGDMAGFAAACYMRGIAFINIPTTVLSQVDSSTGGKTAVDFAGIKNLIGAFYQPQCVLIDPNTLSTLPKRQIVNGLVEALKMGLLFDERLVEQFEKPELDLEAIIARSVELKAAVVEQDEKESGLRRTLNFGHTIGHAIEGSDPDFTWLHGECVAAGMLYFIEDKNLHQRVLKIYERLGLPRIKDFDQQKAANLLVHDKKGAGKSIWVIQVSRPGVYSMEKISWQKALEILKEDPYEKFNRD